MLRVQAAMDRATVKELHMCLANEHQGEHVFLYVQEGLGGLQIRFATKVNMILQNELFLLVFFMFPFSCLLV